MRQQKILCTADSAQFSQIKLETFSDFSYIHHELVFPEHKIDSD